MTDEEIIARRWTAQGLDATTKSTPEAVAAKLLAMQAQDDLAILWAVAVRANCSEAEVTAAIEQGRIVRTWPMRGTLHLMAAEDVRWMVGLLAPTMLARMEARFSDLGLDAKTIGQAERVLLKVLANGPATRETVMEELANAEIPTEKQRGYFTLTFLAHQGLICRGPRQGKKATFVLTDSWIPKSPPLDREEALAKLALRYFQSHGPATVHDLSHWSALTPKQARIAAESVSDHLQSWKVERTTYYGAKDLTPQPANGLTLLPGFDEYLLGYKDRSHILEKAHATLVVPGGNGVFKPMMVQDGRVVGTWRRQLKARSVEISFHPFDKSPGIASLRKEAEKYADFLGPGLTLKLVDPDPGL